MARLVLRVGLLVAVAAALGCGKRPPQFIEVSGVVLLNGQPLPNAKVEFVPDVQGFGAEINSFGISDDQGRFTLARSMSREPGTAVAKSWVLITELPTPREYRSQDPATQARFAEYQAKLKNRPIPAGYGSLATAMVIEVKPDQKEYTIELTR
jgi:hypothetical protein